MSSSSENGPVSSSSENGPVSSSSENGPVSSSEKSLNFSKVIGNSTACLKLYNIVESSFFNNTSPVAEYTANPPSGGSTNIEFVSNSDITVLCSFTHPKSISVISYPIITNAVLTFSIDPGGGS